MTYKIIGGDKLEYGPATGDELRQWIAEGRLSRDTLVRTEPDGMWRPLSNFAEFSQALSEQAQALGMPSAPPPLRSLPLNSREFRVGDCLGRAWHLWMSNFGLFFSASLLVWLISMSLQFLPFVGVIYWVLRGVLFGGLFIVFLRRVRGEDTSVSEALSGFGANFTQLVLVGIATSMLTWIGFMFCVIPGIYLSIAWSLSLPAAADQRAEFWTAMERSRRAVSGQFSKMLVLCLIAFLPAILTAFYAEVKIAVAMYEALKPLLPASGPPDFAVLLKEMNRVAVEIARTGFPLVIASKFALLLNLPFGISALACAYEELIGKPESDRKTKP